ncbi:PREDICTED: uncharacterized protein LOC108766838 [Trachymyrmex cornetzi]|uniref:uncharacterized protein LOC108766826 n=1 Tax=Trachymyrmex cornetzi TaxID=471704 RepID=UPI00084EEF7C|nr:PREDICTED: uncharacterized protein LOC108766826 [Trachymyrmex cornetzi]XP_018371870.1 PREDICTED: uncharacterized protein LOC108766838 [Trachymyrmex cornetzi]
MEDLLQLAMYDFNFVEDVIIQELLAPRNNAFIRNMQYEGLDLNNLMPQECKAKFRFEREHIGRLAAALGIPYQIETENRYVVSGIEGLCIYLRRLAYPNRLSDLEIKFGLSVPYLSVISNTVMRLIQRQKGHLLTDLNNLPWLNRNKLEYYSQVRGYN